MDKKKENYTLGKGCIFQLHYDNFYRYNLSFLLRAFHTLFHEMSLLPPGHFPGEALEYNPARQSQSGRLLYIFHTKSNDKTIPSAFQCPQYQCHIFSEYLQKTMDRRSDWNRSNVISKLYGLYDAKSIIIPRYNISWLVDGCIF